MLNFLPEKHDDGHYRLKVDLRGYELIHEPLLNKGSAFSEKERQELGLQGLIPSATMTMDQQARRIHKRISALQDDFQRYIALSNLQDRNEHLFYYLLLQHLDEYMPIVYTPTVGEATQKYSQVFRRGRGIWITPEHKGRMREVLQLIKNTRDISLMVVTDGESILGIGDQGAGGMAISVGKLSLYCAGAGIHPAKTLPVCIDVGTNNQSLLDDEFYIGWPHSRITGDEYDALIAEFVAAVTEVFPEALIQWEDFRKNNALSILDTYRDSVPSFNDDIQGTGAVALAGVLSALRVSGEALQDQRIVIYGAGAAGLGIARQLRAALAEAGLSGDALQGAIAVLDSRGLINDRQEIRDSYKKSLAWNKSLLTQYGLSDDLDLQSVITKYHPTILIGTSGQAGAFNESIITGMAKHADRPIILPFSNPTDLAEAMPANLYKWTKGRCLVATGSPFNDVEFDGKQYRIGQGNNVFIFPGLGLAAITAKIQRISDNMITAASRALAEQVSEEELSQGLLFPSIDRLREVSTEIAKAVIQAAMDADNCKKMNQEDIAALLNQNLWNPDYIEYTAR